MNKTTRYQLFQNHFCNQCKLGLRACPIKRALMRYAFDLPCTVKANVQMTLDKGCEFFDRA